MWTSKNVIPIDEIVIPDVPASVLAARSIARSMSTGGDKSGEISGGGRTSNKRLNTNDKIDWTFPDHPDLSHLEGWKRQKQGSDHGYQYISPGEIICQSISEVRKLVEEEKESGETKKRKRAAKQENTNEIEPCIFDEKQRTNILKDKKTGQVYRLTDESKLTGWKQQKTVNKKATIFIAPGTAKRFKSMPLIRKYGVDNEWIEIVPAMP